MGEITVGMVRFYCCQMLAMQMADYYYPNCYGFDRSRMDGAKYRKWSGVYGRISNAFVGRFGRGAESRVNGYLRDRYKSIFDVRPILKEISDGDFVL